MGGGPVGRTTTLMADGAAKTKVEDGEVATVEGGEAGTTVVEAEAKTAVEDGEIAAEGAGDRPQTTQVLAVVVGGVPPARRIALLPPRPNPLRRRLLRATHRRQLLRKTPGVHQTTLGVHRMTLGVHLVALGVHRMTLGVRRVALGAHPMTIYLPMPGARRALRRKPRIPSPPVAMASTKGRARSGALAQVITRVGKIRRTLKPLLAHPLPEEVGENPLRLSVSPKVRVLNLPLCFIYYQSGALTGAFLWLFSVSDPPHAASRLDTTPTAMDIDGGEPHFEGKAIFNALEKIVQKRRNKRKRSQDDIGQFPRYYHNLPTHAPSGVDGDGDALMGNTTNRPARNESPEDGEIQEAPPCIEYDMKILSCEPKTSEEKTTFAKHLV